MTFIYYRKVEYKYNCTNITSIIALITLIRPYYINKDWYTKSFINVVWVWHLIHMFDYLTPTKVL
jgi:hypothetical protein